MRGRIASAQPEMKNGEQASYTGQHGTMYTFMVAIEGGPTGQVSSKSPAPYRFRVGDEVDYTFTPPAQVGWTGKMKVEKPKDQGSAPMSNGAAPQSEQRSSGWSPAKEGSVMIQGLLKSIIESGMKSDSWKPALLKALEIHDEVLPTRIVAPVTAPVAQPSRIEQARAALAQPLNTATPDNSLPALDKYEEDESSLPF